MGSKFRYFERPHDFSTYHAEPQYCDLCRRSHAGYDGPFCGPKSDVEFICERCLASGRLAERDLTTCNGGDIAALRRQLAELHPDLDEEQRAALISARNVELESRTPNPLTWQDFLWPAHCSDYCVFVKEVGAPDIISLAGDEDPVAFLARHLRETTRAEEAREVWGSIRPDSPQKSGAAYSVGVYLFRCLHCDASILIWDCD